MKKFGLSLVIVICLFAGLSLKVFADDASETSFTDESLSTDESFISSESFNAYEPAPDSKVEYIYIEKSELAINDQQLIAVLFNSLPESTIAVNLCIQYENGQDVLRLSSSAIEEGLAIFDFSVGAAGNYVLTDIEIQLETGSVQVDMGEGAGYVVNTGTEVEDLVVLNNGGQISSEAVNSAIANAYDELNDMGIYRRYEKASGQNLVIVLNAGHDDTHRRDHPDLGVNEQDLNLAIAKACQDELEKYAGVTVHMVREDGSCCRGNVYESETQCLYARTDYAVSVDASIHVSLHNNGLAGQWHDTSGALVYVSGHSDYYAESGKISEEVLSRLEKLGFKDRYGQPTVREFGDDYTYANGDPLDYYHDVRECILAGIPGILIEHGFQDNRHDNALLRDPEILKQMGIADAQALINYYGLELKDNNADSHAKVDSLNLSSDTLSVEIGGTTKLNAIVYPMQTADIQWEISDPDIISIEEERNGINNTLIIHGIATGTVTITATTNGLKQQCIVEVVKGPRALCSDFIERLYTVVLERNSDPKGLNEWVDILYDKSTTAAEVSYGFIFSNEFKNKSYDNETFLRILYRAFFNREADDSGLKDWLNLLEHGVSREKILKGFVESVEFGELCSDFEVLRGSLNLTAPRDQNDNVTMFIYRCYDDILGRKPDESGLNGWSKQIINKVESPKEIIHGFILSKEFISHNYSDEDYIKILYRTFLNREYDPAGLHEWVLVLQNGESRVDVLDGFFYSPEYQELLKGYGL